MDRESLPQPASFRTLLDVHQVAEQLNCSVRHVHRLARTGRMPKAIYVGALVRWDADTISFWIGCGCPESDSGGPR